MIPFLFSGVDELFLRAVLAFFTGLFFMLLFGKRFIKKLIEYKVGQPIRDDKGFLLAELHKEKKNTPTMGGALIIFAVIFSSLFWGHIKSIFTIFPIASLVVFGMIGACDDMSKLKNKSSKGLSGRFRLLLQTVWAILIICVLASPHLLEKIGFSLPFAHDSEHAYDWMSYLSKMSLPFIREPFFALGIFGCGFVFFIQWLTIVGGANSVNLSDGLDGLAAGLSLLATGAIACVSYFMNDPDAHLTLNVAFVQGAGEVCVVATSLMGALLGFLWFNSHPAQVFMGDTGSLAIGGMLGTMAVLLRAEWFFAFVGFIFVLETLSVVIQVISFQKFQRRVFRCSPLHHHFEYGGLPETKVVMRFWIVGAVLALLGILSIKYYI